MVAKYLYCTMLVIYFLLLVVQTNRFNSLITSNREIYRTGLLVMVLILGSFIAFRPLDISDATPYYNRYYIEPVHTTINDILNDSSFYRGTGYSMSKPVNLLFYAFYKMHFPYQLFILMVVLVEIAVCFKYTRKIFREFKISYNEYSLLVMLMLFYSFRYQFIAFAQGISMCLAMPILYCLLKRKYVKTTFLVILAGSIHVAALFFVVIALIYIFTIRMTKRTYVVMWLLLGIFEFSGIGFRLGERVIGLAEFVIGIIVDSNPVLMAYSSGEGSFTFSATNFLLWILFGVFILVSCDNEAYWKLINVNLIAIMIGSLFGRWEIVHRFTDITKIYIPIIMIIYLHEAKPSVLFPGRCNKEMTLLAVLGFGFIHGLSLLGFV